MDLKTIKKQNNFEVGCWYDSIQLRISRMEQKTSTNLESEIIRHKLKEIVEDEFSKEHTKKRYQSLKNVFRKYYFYRKIKIFRESLLTLQEQREKFEASQRMKHKKKCFKRVHPKIAWNPEKIALDKQKWNSFANRFLRQQQFLNFQEALLDYLNEKQEKHIQKRNNLKEIWNCYALDLTNFYQEKRLKSASRSLHTNLKAWKFFADTLYRRFFIRNLNESLTHWRNMKYNTPKTIMEFWRKSSKKILSQNRIIRMIKVSHSLSVLTRFFSRIEVINQTNTIACNIVNSSIPLTCIKGGIPVLNKEIERNAKLALNTIRKLPKLIRKRNTALFAKNYTECIMESAISIVSQCLVSKTYTQPRVYYSQNLKRKENQSPNHSNSFAFMQPKELNISIDNDCDEYDDYFAFEMPSILKKPISNVKIIANESSKPLDQKQIELKKTITSSLQIPDSSNQKTFHDENILKDDKMRLKISEALRTNKLTEFDQISSGDTRSVHEVFNVLNQEVSGPQFNFNENQPTIGDFEPSIFSFSGNEEESDPSFVFEDSSEK